MKTKPQSVMIIEDEAFVALWLQREMERSGYKVLGRAASGEAAIELAEESAPDFCLCDIRLAGAMDGIDTAERLQKLCNPGILFMTGYPDADTASRAEALHPLGYMIKPVKVPELLSLLTNPAP